MAQIQPQCRGHCGFDLISNKSKNGIARSSLVVSRSGQRGNRDQVEPAKRRTSGPGAVRLQVERGNFGHGPRLQSPRMRHDRLPASQLLGSTLGSLVQTLFLHHVCKVVFTTAWLMVWSHAPQPDPRHGPSLPPISQVTVPEDFPKHIGRLDLSRSLQILRATPAAGAYKRTFTDPLSDAVHC